MVVKFKKLHLHNFASYADASLELSDMGYTLISGRNSCKLDDAYSNGAGKSALFNGFCFALTGETTQGISNGFENIFSDPEDCWVKLEFTVDADDFEIQRIKTPKQKLLIWINGEEVSGKGIKESREVLNTYLPDLTADIVNGIIVLGQGLTKRFTNNKPSHRKELLENLTKSDFMIQSIKDKLELRRIELQSSLRENEDLSIRNHSQLEVYQKQLQGYEKDLELYNEYKDEKAIQSKIEELQQENVLLEDNIAELNNEIDLKSKSSDELNKQKISLQTQKDVELVEITSDINKAIEEVNKEFIEINCEIKNLEKEISNIESIVDICPTCKQKIPEVNKPSTEKEYRQLDSLKRHKESISDKLLTLKENRDVLINEHFAKYKDKISLIDNQLNEIRTEITANRANISTLELSKSATSLQIYKLEELKARHARLKKDISTCKGEITKINKKSSKIEVEKATLQSRLDLIQQMTTLAKREFRGILLSNVIEYIDRKVKQYSKEVFGTTNLSFTLNDNYIDITYCDKLYENLSGGEKQKIDVIVQLALRDILSKQLNLHFNLLVLDEIYDGLDSVSCQKITNLISSLTDIDSIFIISHHVQDLEITYDNNLKIEKNASGISTISF